MCRREKQASRPQACEGAQACNLHATGRLAGKMAGLLLVLLGNLSAASAQEPIPSPKTASPNSAAAPASPATVPLTTVDDGHGEASLPWGWEVYVDSGPTFAVGGGLSNHVTSGWVVEGGARQMISCVKQPWALFVDLGVGFTTIGGNASPVETSIIAAMPDSTSHVINDFFLTTLAEYRQLSGHVALGGSYYPAMLNDDVAPGARAGREVFLTGRFGVRAGFFSTEYNQTATPGGITELLALEAIHNNNGQSLPVFHILDNGVKNHDAFVGMFGGLGVGVRWHEASLAGFRLGDVAVGAEVVLGNDWFNLRDFAENTNLLTISPRLTLSFAF
jgi:hypothetical protein